MDNVNVNNIGLRTVVRKMKKRVVALTVGMLLAGLPSMNAQVYDFCDTSASGHALYYNINADSVTVTVTHPSYLHWGGIEKPMGNLAIPTTATHDTVTYLVTGVDSSAFALCSRLKSVSVPGTVTWIGKEAFAQCDSLEVFRMGIGVTSLGSAVWRGCRRLTTISVGEGNPVYDSRDDCNAIIETATNTLLVGSKNTTIPVSVRTVADGAFAENELLESIVVPDSVTSLGDRAFADCKSLGSVVLPSELPHVGQQLFSGCVSLTNVNLPSSLTVIPTGMFEGCSGLRNVTIPASVTEIGDLAFCSCSDLIEVRLPNSLLTVGAHAFSDCRTLETLVIPDGVTAIGADAFWHCTGLYEVKLGASVSSIGRTAFSRCVNLKRVMSCNPEPPVVSEDSFHEVKDTIPIYVPHNTRSLYAARWSYFSHFVESDLTAIESVVTDDGVRVTVADGQLRLAGVAGRRVRLHDLSGRLLLTVAGGQETMTLPVPATGVYLLQVGDAPARKVSVWE